jgi:hypothetical protein
VNTNDCMCVPDTSVHEDADPRESATTRLHDLPVARSEVYIVWFDVLAKGSLVVADKESDVL